MAFTSYFRVIGLCGLLMMAGHAQAVCTVSASAVNLGAITIGVEARGFISPVANCTAATPYSYSFSSVNGGAGGKLVSGTCALNYSIVSYTVNGGIYGSGNYFILPAPSLIGTGVNQTDAFGLVVSAVQGGCILAPNSAAITVTDTVIVSVNY
jgi:hypothetical protein